MTFINLSPKFEYAFRQTIDNRDDRQNGRRLSLFAVVGPCGQSIFNNLFQFSYMDYFHQPLLPIVNMGFLQRTITKIPKEMIAACQFTVRVLVYTLTQFFHVSYVDYFYETLAEVRIRVLSDKR